MVALAQVPVPARVGVGRDRLEHERGRTVGERAVHDVRMARDPSNVSDACVHLSHVVIECVVMSKRGPKQVAGGGVHHALGLAGRAARVEQKQGLLARHWFGRAEGALLGHRLMHPRVASLDPAARGPCPLVHEHGLDALALGGEGGVDDALELDHLRRAQPLVRRQHQLALRVDHTRAQSLC